MIIFRIIFNLIGILLALATRALWLPILLVKRNLFLVILLVVALVIYTKCSQSQMPAELTPAAPVASTPAPAAPGDNKRSKQAPKVVIEPVTKREDGTSGFATDLYKLMTDDQRGYYSHIYYWAMANLPDGQTHAWVNGNMYGSFTPTRTFSNNAGGTCRNFKETLKVRHIEQQISGIACLKPDMTWCKLQPNATPTCGLGGSMGFWNTIKSWFR